MDKEITNYVEKVKDGDLTFGEAYAECHDTLMTLIKLNDPNIYEYKVQLEMLKDIAVNERLENEGYQLGENNKYIRYGFK